MPTPIARRGFLTASALTLAGVAVACTDDTDSPDGVSGWDKVRAQFDLDPDYAHFAAFVLASHPKPVREAIDRHRRALDRDPAGALSEESELDDAVRTAVSGYLGGASGEVALTDSTTMGLALVYQGLQLSAGDDVLTTTHDFYSTHESLRIAAARTGARVRRVALYDKPATADAGGIGARLRAAIRPSTRIVALTWVHSSTGVKLPVRAIADDIAEVNQGRPEAARIVLCLDAVHGFGAEDAGPEELGCDVFISGTHKWLFGPRGTGLVWARPSVGTAITPLIPPFSPGGFGRWLGFHPAPEEFCFAATPGGYQPFEHRWAVADAIRFHEAIGRAEVAARTRSLATRMKDGIAERTKARLMTPRDPELSAGIVCCEVPGQDPSEVVERLRSQHQILASVTPYRESLVRFGTSIVTSEEQVDATVEALAEIA